MEHSLPAGHHKPPAKTSAVASDPEASASPRPTSFIFESYTLGDDFKTLEFNYRITFDGQADVSLVETLYLPVEITDPSDTVLHRILVALHIGLGTSYYKTFLPPKLITPDISHSAADFWNTVYRNGLGEFLFTNQLPAERLAQFGAKGVDSAAQQHSYQERAILGIGGGKDSIVAGELLKNIGITPTAFVLGTGEHLGQAQPVIDVMGLETLGVGRKLDPQILELNKLPSAYNGHVPISMVFGLVGVLLAHLTESAYVVVANEASTSIPQATWEGADVNHQWSKSFEFEQLFQHFVRNEIVDGITYFSAIRPITSVAVAKMFSRLPQYFEVFTSDNGVFRIDPTKRPNGRWSLESAKSLSSYILLAPWLPTSELDRIFSIDFMNQPSLERLFLELTGAQGHPPLDCVGTVPEITASLNVAAAMGKFDGSYLLEVATARGIATDVATQGSWQTKFDELLRPLPEQAFPTSLADKLSRSLETALASPPTAANATTKLDIAATNADTNTPEPTA